MDALNAGKHVFTEWPLGATLAEAQEMADLGRAKGVQTMVGLQARAAPAVMYMKELVDSGYVGEVMACNLRLIRGGVLSRTSDRTWQRDDSLGATTLTIACGHAIDALRYVVGDFSDVSSVVSTQAPAVARVRHRPDGGCHRPRQHPGQRASGWRRGRLGPRGQRALVRQRLPA